MARDICTKQGCKIAGVELPSSLHWPQDPRGRCEGRDKSPVFSQHVLGWGRGLGRGQTVSRATLVGRALDPCWVSASWGPAGSSPSFSGLCLTHSGAFWGVRVLGSAGQPGHRRGREVSPRWKWLAGVICLLHQGGLSQVPGGSQGCVPLSTEGCLFPCGLPVCYGLCSCLAA